MVLALSLVLHRLHFVQNMRVGLGLFRTSSRLAFISLCYVRAIGRRLRRKDKFAVLAWKCQLSLIDGRVEFTNSSCMLFRSSDL